VSRVALLDVNVLVALFDPDHVHHDVAHDWFADARRTGWATCPVTENGLVRVLTAHAGDHYRPADIVERLHAFRQSGHHRFWADSVSLSDSSLFVASYIKGHRQVTDIYLLGLATRTGGALATFDRSIPLGAVVGASRKSLLVIAPASSLEAMA
jgi:toxin-antitoxin system PIN domain toxin